MSMRRASDNLRQLLRSGSLEYLLEAHNALSALVVQEAGFPAIWASSLTLAASMGRRDADELTMTELLAVLESMSDRVTIPVLVDGGTGFGTFHHVQRLVRKLEQRAIAGLCLEDQAYPKRNSLAATAGHGLATSSEFCAKIRAAVDARDGLVLVARTEAFIAGLGVHEALDRAHQYVEAGADAVLVHSRADSPVQIAEFMAQWDRRAPVVIVPTTYWQSPASVFQQLGVSAVIWANHNLRASLTAMQHAANELRKLGTSQSLVPQIAPLPEIFRLQNLAGLEAAEQRYGLPGDRPSTAVILAAGMGKRLQGMADDQPKSLLSFNHETLLGRSVRLLRNHGISRIVVVAGHARQSIERWAASEPGVEIVVNAQYATTGTMASLHHALETVSGGFLLLEGDIIYEPRALTALLEDPRSDLVLGSGFTGAGDEVWIETQSGNLTGMSKEHTLLRRIDAELVGITKVSGPLAQKMKQYYEQASGSNGNSALCYETDALVTLAQDHPIGVLIIPDLLWGEVDYEAHYRRIADTVAPRLAQTNQHDT